MRTIKTERYAAKITYDLWFGLVRHFREKGLKLDQEFSISEIKLNLLVRLDRGLEDILHNCPMCDFCLLPDIDAMNCAKCPMMSTWIKNDPEPTITYVACGGACTSPYHVVSNYHTDPGFHYSVVYAARTIQDDALKLWQYWLDLQEMNQC